LLGESDLVLVPDDGGAGARPSMHSVVGRLRSRATGRERAFLLAFVFDDGAHRAGADFLTLALFDLETGEYGTSTEYGRRGRLPGGGVDRRSPPRGRFDLSFPGSRGKSLWRGREAGEGALAPLASVLHAVGADAEGRFMQLDLELDSGKRAFPFADYAHRGAEASVAQPGMRAHLQSGIRFSGTLRWGDEREAVDGECGFAVRQWRPRFILAPDVFHRRRYQHELRLIQLDDGTGIGVWMHFDRRRANRLMPPTLAIVVRPNGEVASTTDFHLERRSFVRDPEIVMPRAPLAGAKYFADRYRLRVPAWGLDLLSEPCVTAPAHAFPVDYWSGPTRLTGILDGAPVSGFGFDERTRIYGRDFEIVEVLRETVRHLPAAALPVDGPDGTALANLAWEIDAFIGDGDPQAAVRYLNARVRPAIEALAEPHRSHVRTITDDAADALLRWWVRP
jgi:hypothetical protein